MGYRSGILRLEFLAFLPAVRIEKKIEKKGIAFEISHRFTGFWHLMTGDKMNQTSEVLTDAHMIKTSCQSAISGHFQISLKLQAANPTNWGTIGSGDNKSSEKSFHEFVPLCLER